MIILLLEGNFMTTYINSKSIIKLLLNKLIVTWEEIQDVAYQSKKTRQEAEDALIMLEGDIPICIFYLRDEITKQQAIEKVKERKDNL